MVIYFSSESGNTKRLVENIGIKNFHINDAGSIEEPYILVVPSYCGGKSKGVVHPLIVKFLNEEANRKYLRGVIGTGNTNFGRFFCRSAEAVAHKCKVPLLQKIEVFGTEEDISEARHNIKNTLGEQNGA